MTGEAADGGDSGDGDGDVQGQDRVEKAYRGISQRLAVRYLRNLGGERVDGETDEETSQVRGSDWTASLSAEKVNVAGSLTLTEVSITFEGDPETLPELVERFSQKAMRAGG